MARRTKDEAVATRNQILDAAERVFSARGVSRTSLADIAEAAAVTRGAIYWHFRDKADLFCEMVARVTMPMEDAPCQINPALAADPLASVRAMLTGILQRTSGDAQARRVFHIVFHKCEYVDEMEPVRKRFSEMQAGCLSRLEQGLRAAIERGQLPVGLNAQRAAVGLHALLDGLISSWVRDPDSMPPANAAGPVIDVFLDGISRALPTRATKKRTAGARKALRQKSALRLVRRRSA
ncbi:MAG: TetR family transcriptional regulator [Burkholderiales bacterium]|nr:TetR family transcriptional regulator [Burkholderiales bacterium]